MHVIPIYDKNGVQVNQIEIDDVVEHIDGRVSKGKNSYYKGLGGPYRSHNMLSGTYSDEYELIEESTVFYVGDIVRKKSFVGKSGIFQERFQPQFEDYINSCGVKELSIIENSMFFDLSSVVVNKSERYDTENNQYYFVLDYKCGRQKYLNGGDPKKLKNLLNYMVQSGWNFVWDKRSITDISYNGLVTDVADIFKSNNLDNLLGTVYSVLYSLGNMDFNKYVELISEYGLTHSDSSSYVFNSAEVLRRNGIDIREFLNGTSTIREVYENMVLNYLIVGRNCGHCDMEGVGEKVKQSYIVQTKKLFNKEN